MHAHALEDLEEYMQPGHKVLDVGCGSGYRRHSFPLLQVTYSFRLRRGSDRRYTSHALTFHGETRPRSRHRPPPRPHRPIKTKPPERRY